MDARPGNWRDEARQQAQGTKSREEILGAGVEREVSRMNRIEKNEAGGGGVAMHCQMCMCLTVPS